MYFDAQKFKKKTQKNRFDAWKPFWCPELKKTFLQKTTFDAQMIKKTILMPGSVNIQMKCTRSSVFDACKKIDRYYRDKKNLMPRCLDSKLEL